MPEPADAPRRTGSQRGVLYAAALVIGMNRFHGEPRYWIPAAVVVGAPMIAGAWRESRA